MGAAVASEITRLPALDRERRAYVILAITPVETVYTYHGVRRERGRVRYELSDGTALVKLSDRQFRVEPTGTIIEVVETT